MQYNVETHVPNLAVRVMLTLLPAVHKYSYPTRMEKGGWGFTIIHDASPLPSQNCLVEDNRIAVARIDRYVCSAGLRRDEIGIAEATLNDLDAQATDRFNVGGIPHERRELELRVGLDKLSKHSA